MKKIYNSPMTTVVELKIQSALMEPSIYDVKSDNASYSREGNNNWEDE